ncbi:MAG: F0F1 ATP synthase subunit B [Ruminococcus sp.]|jgi:F-type H+-transporting ATPase subunit b|nr:F0F1 ATP synthase subunit B [Ruminococcus sp.]
MLHLDANIIWTFINILILYLLLRMFLFKPINKIMDERAKKIQDDLDNAKKSKEEAEQMRADYNETLATASDKARQIVEEAVGQAESERSEIMARAEKENLQLYQSTQKSIENERKRSVQEAQSQIADLAIAAASKIIAKNVDDSSNRQIVDEFLAENQESGDEK